MRTTLAYALAFAGALLLIESMMYLLTAGSTSGKLATLAIACQHRDLLPDCVVQSERWARQIPFFLLLAIIGVKVAALLQSTAKRLGGLSVAEVLRKPNDPFVLYLRPFDTDDVILPTPRLPPLSRFLSYRPFPVRIEEELFDVADGYRPLIAVGKPGGSKQALGGLAYRTYLDNSEWQAYVAQKIHDAERIVLLIKDSAGVRWELERVIREGAAAKTLFLVDPAIEADATWDALARDGRAVAATGEAGAIEFGFQSRPIGFFLQGRKLVQIVNANRTATSYRTAFSYFSRRPARCGIEVDRSRRRQGARRRYFAPLYRAISRARSVNSSQGKRQILRSATRCCSALFKSPVMRYASPMYSCAPRWRGSSWSARL
jgi:hypothetical protein